MSTVSLPLGAQNHTYKAASTDLTPLGRPFANGLGAADGATLISPFPPPTSASTSAHAHILAPTTLPPHYESIPRSSRSTSPGTPGVSFTSTSVQTLQNKEKQALRDAWAKQDLAHPAEINNRRFSSRLTSPSVHPSSSGSYASRGHSADRPTSTNASPGSSARQSATSAPSILGYKGSLPPGMDIQEALAKCEDPALGWSLTFWVTIADPVTQHVFFACPASGQCSWDPPVGAFVVPRSPEGEWWELADSSRNNRSYYYNTLTGKTQWTRPSDAFVIPLGLIQRNALPNRHHQRSAHSSPSHLTPFRGDLEGHSSNNVAPTAPQTPRSGPRPPPFPRVTPGRQGSSHSDNLLQSPPLLTPTLSFPDGTPTGASPKLAFGAMDKQSGLDIDVFRQPVLARAPLSIVDEGSGNETDMSDNSSPSGRWYERRKSKMSGLRASPKKGSKAWSLPATAEESSNPSSLMEHVQVTPPTSNGSAQRGPELPKVKPSSPIFVDSVKTKCMSTGLHPLLPTAISTEIRNFQADDFASKYFATKRSGMLRARVPLERIMEWQKQPISQPLLVLSKSLVKDATTTFRVIQHAMGERDRPVENAKITSTVQRDVRGPDRSRHSTEKMIVLEEVRWMLQVGVTAGEMRDEIYSQLIKQLTKNPDHDATVLGFQLFCVLVNSFAPSKNFEVFVRRFLRKEIIGSDGISVMCRYCLTKLVIMVERGGRGRTLTVGEIEHASDAAFYPTVYGEKLERIMDLQEQSYPSSRIPIVLTFLTNGILALGGLASEGIFRVPGDGDCVAELKSRIDRGHYRLEDIDDPHVAASLFKQWLRELAVPLIPEELYNAALTASKSTPDTLAFISRLPTIHLRVLLHVISFIQLFLTDEVIAVTKMTPQNLALVLAPNILRTTSNHLETVFTNASFESTFVLRLLEHLEPDKVDPDFVPLHGASAT